MANTVRCCDCGHYWPAHLKAGKVVGCPHHSKILAKAIIPVTIRLVRSGVYRGHTFVTFPECHDETTGTILVLNLDTEQYHELAVVYVQRTCKRLGGLGLERAKDRVEDWLGYQVRVVGK